MPRTAISFGAALIAVGVIGFLFHFITVGAAAPTALIPAIAGVILAGLGFAAMQQPNMRKHLMHAAAMVGLLGTVAPLMPLFTRWSAMSGLARASNIVMLALSATFLVLCVRSFIEARKTRESIGG